ncbi:MAG: imidazole glycerol phosphate synthase subunit HisH [Chitinophagaceae bacterium]|nr:imidazole glycerol phosphate synthase subunit HisH [Chitinophagaceae bacterium]
MTAILQYNAGNIASVKNALDRLGAESVVTSDPAQVLAADRLIIPGVGEAGSAMNWLRERELDLLIRNYKKPVLGICLGLQLLCQASEEGNTTCIGVFDNTVRLFPSTDIIPHMGWNNLSALKGELFNGIEESDNFYFVHSYYADVTAETAATTDYILPFSAALQVNNFYATQFHPEKSAEAGERILKNFLAL